VIARQHPAQDVDLVVAARPAANVPHSQPQCASHHFVTIFRAKAIPSGRRVGLDQNVDTKGCARIADEAGFEIKLLEELEDRVALAALVAKGNSRQFDDPRFRRELAAWIHSKRLGSRNGMSGASFGMPDLLSGIGGLVIRTFDMGEGIAAADETKILSGTPALLVFGSAETTTGWINTVRALGRATLLATSQGPFDLLSQSADRDRCAEA
jgi:hypothetical protein